MDKGFLLRRVPRALEGGPSERHHLLGVGREDSELGAKDYQTCVAGGNRDLGITTANVLVFAAPPCTAGTYGRLPDLVGGRTP